MKGGVAAAAPGPGVDTQAYANALDGALHELLRLENTATTELLLIRHGEPAPGPAAGGGLDPHLSERGHFQSLRLAMRLRSVDLEAVYASTAPVAVETAALVAGTHHLPVIRAPQLRDLVLHPAALNGSGGDLQELQREVSTRLISHPRWDALRGVEATRQFRHRSVQSLEAIVSRHPGGRVAVVTHQPVINAYISMVLGIERDMFFQPEFTSVSTLRVLRDLYAVQTLNDQAHLMREFAPR